MQTMTDFSISYVHNVETHSTHPIIPPTDPPVTSYATWSPTGESIAYVTNNDLYVLTSPLCVPIFPSDIIALTCLQAYRNFHPGNNFRQRLPLSRSPRLGL
jgi:Dipeptidyl peptidase IV (DPP IV) N-terminal region